MAVEGAKKLVAAGRGGWIARGLLGPTSDELSHLASAEHWVFIEVSLVAASDKKTLMRQLAEQLQFPENFGANWDALADALWDVGTGASGVLLRLKGLGQVPGPLSEPLSEILDDRTRNGPVPLVVIADPPLPAVAVGSTGSEDTRDASQ